MMLPTHALAGMVLALPVALAAPEYAGVALLAGLLGGILPDLDLYVAHRKTLHYPVYYSVGGATAVVAGVLAPTPLTVAVAVFLVAAAVHSVSDVFGGGLELRPWEETSERAVYDHFRGRWVAPRRWVGYDGSPADLALSVALAVPLLATQTGLLQLVVVATLVVAVSYVAVRRALPSLVVRLVSVLPTDVHPHLPERYVASRTGQSIRLEER
ncbi:metal-dependent hydrolase [Halobacterium wangiae]|uniref:metal-dependent hydrolase n=1 Tax=Halobacterium wangiae TaxID=2902623 RepID=UPI001E324DF0|nr:metal-dependent hydrolase [Halobacterium wangiae]